MIYKFSFYKGNLLYLDRDLSIILSNNGESRDE